MADTLPPLPTPSWARDLHGETEVYTVDELRAYAIALRDGTQKQSGLALQRQQRNRRTHMANTVHKLKTDSEVFEAVRRGDKTFEIRFNDRGFQVGDRLELHETAYTGAEMKAGQPLLYTGRAEVREVSHVLTGYGLMDGWCCLSFKNAVRDAAVAAERADAERYRWLANNCDGNEQDDFRIWLGRMIYSRAEIDAEIDAAMARATAPAEKD